jgi:predicted dehydrogenase
MEKRKLRGGMVGGGRGSKIGAVHRMAATIDGQAEIVAGAFSSDPEKSRSFADELYLDSSRAYSNYREMAEKESALPAGERIDFVSIATPNASHFDVARTFLEAGFNVICDKPMTCRLAEAQELKSIVSRSGKVFALTYTYTGYPMVKHARFMIQQGLLGEIVKVVAAYRQTWVARLLQSEDSLLNVWRLDPNKAGISCCIADIGIHAENLVRYVTGLEIEELCADLSSFVPGNSLDNDASILLRYKGGSKGIMHVSQVYTGEENEISIQVYGTKQGLSWSQYNQDYLEIKTLDGYSSTYTKGSRGSRVLCDEARNASRLALGHPEGFIEAFANIYLGAFNDIRAQQANQPIPAGDYPTVDDGVSSMAFVETVVASAKSDEKWVRMKGDDAVSRL